MDMNGVLSRRHAFERVVRRRLVMPGDLAGVRVECRAYSFPTCGPFLWKLGAFWRPFSFRARYDRGATQSCLEQIMSKGTVKWFNPTKGYGFIQPQGGGGRDVFVHISAVERAGLSSLNEGQVVEYEEVSNRGKISAENLKVQR
jgi:CspA family cold shock protein